MNILEKMKKVIFSVLTLLLTMNIAFAQGKKTDPHDSSKRQLVQSKIFYDKF